MLFAEGKLSLKEAMISFLDNLLKYLGAFPFPTWDVILTS